MEQNNKDIVIASLEFAREKLLKGEMTSRGEFSNFLVENKFIKPNDIDHKRDMITALFEQINSFQDSKFSTRFMGLDSYLGLLDYEELQLARQDSTRAREEARQAIHHAEEATRLTRQALFWTKVAVIIATLVGIGQIIVTFI